MKKLNITNAVFEDKRLIPLNKSTSKVVLQLFVSKITHEKIKSYEILYGWCIITSRPEISTETTIGSFEKIYTSEDTTCEIARLSIYNHPDVILLLVNEMLGGKTFKESAALAGINTNKIPFDFSYSAAIDGNVRLRSIIFNETSGTVSRNMFEKYAFHSPYGNTPSFTLPLVNLDKLKLFRTTDGYYPDFKRILLCILEYLTSETKMSFSSTECARFGNIEFINGQCANIYERALAYFRNISNEEDVDGIKEKNSKKVKVTILPNEITASQSLLINCFSTSGGQVILDEIKEVYHESGNTIILDFDTQEPVSNLVVSIWVKDGEKWQIWYKHSAVLLRSIVTRIGMVGTTGKVSSPYLEKVLASGSHLKGAVDKAKEINRTSYQTSSIGGNRLDPWVDADYNFSKLVKSIVPEKSDSVFFPKGWNTESEEHGALAFLDWFKSICDEASNVIIQDPYFDVVGLEFLARTSNSATSFNVITCTQTPSDDDTKAVKPSLVKRLLSFVSPNKKKLRKVPDRAIRLTKMLTGFPELFSSVKITINDLRNKSGASKNLLHDRYIIVYSGDKEPKGFHLSNSIQHATESYPLLITSIPLDVLESVERYSSALLDEANGNGAIEVIKLYDEQRKSENTEKEQYIKKMPPDEQLFAELKSFVRTEEGPNYEAIKQIFNQYINDDESKFEKFWETFGYFLANVPTGDGLLYQVKDWFSPSRSYLLKEYLRNLAHEKSLDKFRSDRDLGRSGYHLLFLEDFDKALEASFRAENNFFENYGFGNYAAGYASWVLLNIDGAAFVDLLNLIQVEIVEREKTENINRKPILRIAAILFADLAKSLFWIGESEIIKSCLSSKLMSLRTLGIAAVATDAVEKKEEMTLERVSELLGLLSFDERVKTYVALLHQSRFDRGIPQEQLHTYCFKELLQILTGKESVVIFTTIERIVSNRYFELIDSLTMNNLLMPLLDAGSITMHEIQSFWRLKFEKELQECDSISKNAGILNLAGKSICIAENADSLDFVNSLIKISKRYFASIRKPFMSGTTAWENDYNRLLLIQTVAMIAINYLKSCQDASVELSDKLSSLVNEINTIKINYPFFSDVYEIHRNNKKVADGDFS